MRRDAAAESSRSEDSGWLRPVPVLAALSVVLLVSLVAVSVMAWSAISDRDEQIADLNDEIVALTSANEAYDEQVSELISERDGLADEVSQIAAELDSLQGQYDAINQEYEDLQNEATDLESQVAELDGELEESDRQLQLAQEEGSEQQARAESAESLSLLLTEIVLLDEEIHAEYAFLVTKVVEGFDYYDRGLFSAAEVAVTDATNSMARLDQLFAEREELVNQFG